MVLCRPREVPVSKDGISANLVASLAIYMVLLGGLVFMGRDWQPPGAVAAQNIQPVQSEASDNWVQVRAHREDRDCSDYSHSNIWCEE